MAGLGDTFMLPKPGQHIEHLWVLITKPDPKTGQAIMINVTTQRSHSDTTTILRVGDHPFIQKPSVVFYADARFVDIVLLDQGMRAGTCRAHAAFSPEVLARIQAGVAISPMTPKKIKEAYSAAELAGLV